MPVEWLERLTRNRGCPIGEKEIKGNGWCPGFLIGDNFQDNCFGRWMAMVLLLLATERAGVNVDQIRGGDRSSLEKAYNHEDSLVAGRAFLELCKMIENDSRLRLKIKEEDDFIEEIKSTKSSELESLESLDEPKRVNRQTQEETIEDRKELEQTSAEGFEKMIELESQQLEEVTIRINKKTKPTEHEDDTKSLSTTLRS
ncbi:hypothetical protein BY996DRAFT_6522079 [Phakopsora pachyrhizi]|nr:hypothetical protein BY996DRAFT_6522079 [Phakopsora pachyrhizi]